MLLRPNVIIVKKIDNLEKQVKLYYLRCTIHVDLSNQLTSCQTTKLFLNDGFEPLLLTK